MGVLLGMLVCISKVDFKPSISMVMFLRPSFPNIFNFEPPPPTKKRVLLLVSLFNFGLDFRVFDGNITRFLRKWLQKNIILTLKKMGSTNSATF
jgi:hypothetical protein